MTSAWSEYLNTVEVDLSEQSAVVKIVLFNFNKKKIADYILTSEGMDGPIMVAIIRIV